MLQANGSGSVIALLLGLGVVLANGFTDAPGSISGVVSSGIWSHKRACAVCGIFNFAGVIAFSMLSGRVAESVFNSADFGNYAVYGICASLIGVIAFSLLCWIFSMPSSESHALISCIFGSSLAISGAGSLGYFIFAVLCTVISCALSLLISLISGSILQKCRGEWIKSEKISCILSSFMHGGQDGQKFVGLLVFLTVENGVSSGGAKLWIYVAVGVFMLLGTLMCGKKIITSLGNGIVKNTEKIAFVSDFSATVCIFLCSLAGFSVSTGNIKACSLIGAGICEKQKINYKTVIRIAAVSLITFPLCIGLGYALTRIFILLF